MQDQLKKLMGEEFITISILLKKIKKIMVIEYDVIMKNNLEKNVLN